MPHTHTSGCILLSWLLAFMSSLGWVVSILGGLRNRLSSCCWLSLRLWMMLHDCCCFYGNMIILSVTEKSTQHPPVGVHPQHSNCISFSPLQRTCMLSDLLGTSKWGCLLPLVKYQTAIKAGLETSQPTLICITMGINMFIDASSCCI